MQTERAVPHDAYAALRFRDFRLYLISSVIGVIGGQIMTVALGFELWERTKDPMVLAWIGLIRFVPVLIFTLPAGQAADWYDRRHIMLLSQVVSAVAALALGWLSLNQGAIPLMYLCLLVRSVAITFGGPARTSLLPYVIVPEHFTNAITWNSSAFQLALMLGPVLGGMAVTFSVPLAYVFDAACLTVAFAATAAMRTKTVERTHTPASLAGLAAGIHFIYKSKRILAAVTLDTFAMMLGGATALLPIYASDILHVGGSGLGWLRSAPAMGAVVMAFVLAHSTGIKRAGPALLFSVFGFGVAMVIFGLSKSFWLSFAMLFLTGALDNISVVVRHTMVQMLAPDSLRGRISAANSMFIGASNQLGEFESGLVAAWFSPVVSAVTGGIGTMLVVVAVALAWPQIRKLGALNELKAEEDPLETAKAP
ncbi:MAG TPA: MFS transporter [Planctomycetota bacterium]|nr:MFS transporter [Planctomycetota bacterium]